MKDCLHVPYYIVVSTCSNAYKLSQLSLIVLLVMDALTYVHGVVRCLYPMLCSHTACCEGTLERNRGGRYQTDGVCYE